MISYYGKQLQVEHFPDNTQRLFGVEVNADEKDVTICWSYENDEELVSLQYLVWHIREKAGEDSKIRLIMYYIPNARMDRVNDDTEIFTLKWFARIINSLNFSDVLVLDPHSNVSLGLIDRIRVVDVKPIILEAINRVMTKDGKFAIYFPDAGAMDRYKKKKLVPEDIPVFYGHKVRDGKNGKIIGMTAHKSDGTKLVMGDLEDCNILMIDDIISFGGTLAYSADMLAALNVKSICAYASHVEKSVLDEEKGTLLTRLKNGIVEKVYSPCTIPLPDSKFIEKL